MFVIPVPQGDVALSIALGVLLLSIVVQPIVRTCFYRMRSDRAWRSIEKNNSVDVTKYGILAEALGDRGKWDTARIVVIVLTAYNVCTWGLELSLDLALHDGGPVDLLNRPPPVCHKVYDGIDTATNSTDWVVNPGEAPASPKGTLKNFKESLEDGHATTVYRIGEDLFYGSTEFVKWSTDISVAPSDLFYNVTNGQATVASLDCMAFSRNATLHISSNKKDTDQWGTVVECESGPRIVNDIRSDTTESPPTILLNRSDGDVHLIVEEVASYPSFLYSVWKLDDDSSSSRDVNASVNIRHVFFVSSTTRLVEAIITGIANGIESGGGCVDLLSQFSFSNKTYELMEGERVSPFGEHPESSSVAHLSDVESIVKGIKVNDVGAICGFILLGVIIVATVGCLFSLKESPLDVYDRDALIKAVAAPNMEENDGKPTKMKVLVTRMDDDRFRMVVSDDGVYRGCSRLQQRLKKIVVKTSPENDEDEDEDGAAAAAPPTRGISRTWSLPVASFNAGTINRSRQAQSNKNHPAGAARTMAAAAAVGPNSSSQTRAKTFVQLTPSPVPTLTRRTSMLRGLVFDPSTSAGQSKLQGVSDSSTVATAASESQHTEDVVNVSKGGSSGGGSGGGDFPVEKESDRQVDAAVSGSNKAEPAKGDGVKTPPRPPSRDEKSPPVEDTTPTTSSRRVTDSTLVGGASPK